MDKTYTKDSVPEFDVEGSLAYLKEILKTVKAKSVFTEDQKKEIQNIQSRIIDGIRDYNLGHQKAQVGFPVPCSLDVIRPLYEALVETQLEKLKIIKQSIPLVTDGLIRDSYKKMYDEVRFDLATLMIKSCLVIEKQPPQVVVKKNVTLETSIRLLIGKPLLSSANTTKVKCSLLLEGEARKLHEARSEGKSYEIPKGSTIGDLTGFQENHGVYKICYKKLGLQKSGKTTENSNKVAEQKSCFLFQANITLEGETFLVEVLSVPFVVVSKSDYENAAVEATLLWDHAFGVKERKPFDVPDCVTLEQCIEALGCRWTQSNERELTADEKYFLAKKLCPNLQSRDALSGFTVTKSKFSQENLPDVEFTFCEWFYEIMIFVKKYLKDEWIDGTIEGFIGRIEAEHKLQYHNSHTFIIRFMESTLGGLSFAYKDGKSVCQSTEKYDKDDLKRDTLTRIVRDTPDLQCLYSSKRDKPTSPKEEVFILPEEKKAIERRKLKGYPVKKKSCIHLLDGNDTCSTPSIDKSGSIASTHWLPTKNFVSDNSNGSPWPSSMSSVSDNPSASPWPSTMSSVSDNPNASPWPSSMSFVSDNPNASPGTPIMYEILDFLDDPEALSPSWESYQFLMHEDADPLLSQALSPPE